MRSFKISLSAWSFKRYFRYSLLVYGLLLVCMACEKDENTNPPEPKPVTKGLYICYEGGRSGIAYYSLADSMLEKNIFTEQNNRELGHTANDLEQYGGKLYCVVNGSSTVEVMHASNGKLIKQLKMIDKDGKGREPRRIAFYKDKAYVSSFDGTVVRFDTLNLTIDAVTTAGRSQEGICVANGKLYVANSGGKDYPDYDTTVSVINIATFKEEKKITVASNPTIIRADNQGNVYVASLGNNRSEDYRLQRIDGKTGKVTPAFGNVKTTNFVLHKDTAYLYAYDYFKNKYWINIVNCKTGSSIRENFISDGTTLSIPYGINVDPNNGDVYITDAINFMDPGNVLCFGSNGKLKFTLREVGVMPNKVVFLKK